VQDFARFAYLSGWRKGEVASLTWADVDRDARLVCFLRVVRYSLMDACRIIVVHEQNHFAQATRVMGTQGFPA
jgi:integrase